MANMLFKTKGNSSPSGKARVYFTCHPDDFIVAQYHKSVKQWGKIYIIYTKNLIFKQYSSIIWLYVFGGGQYAGA